MLRKYVPSNWHHLLLILYLIVMQLAQWVEPQWVMEQLRFDRQRPQEFWRFFSCHFIHLGVNHFLMNIAGLILLMLCFLKESDPKRDLAVLLFLAVGTSIGIYFFNDLYRYVGFSGVLHGYWVFLLLVTLSRTPLLNTLFAIFLIAKVLAEQWGFYSQAQTAELIGGPVATFSHLSGLVSGLFAASIYFCFKYLLK